ncbi:unnamed protein product [Arabis nemorensis]|uniref:Wall-associated receptor kinase galacturonan-binding domain-containing protein n=1 Tax=Arabis nemorensis TaxID=586526 RepID=A0A565BYW6_9BRAS|nr:unnamed protein product [Arabis nemorensis]
MWTRSSGDIEVDSRGKRKAPEGDDNGRAKRRSVQSNKPKNTLPRDAKGRWMKRSAVQSNEKKNGKILRGIRGCVSPRCSAYTYRSSFSWFEQDIWTYISRFLDGKSLVMLGATNKWFNNIVMEEYVWRFACLRDLQIPRASPVSSSWIKLYASAFDGSHSYLFHQQEKHIDWMRIGAFTLDSRMSLLTESFSGQLRVPREGTIDQMLQSSGSCVIRDIKSGIWIADLQLVRCPVCDLSTCDGSMQTLDARHIELFLNEGYQDGSWEYNLIGSHKIQKDVLAACGAIFDLKHLKASSSTGILHLKSWIGEPGDSRPKAVIAPHAVAVHTRLQENEGILVKYHTMKAGTDGNSLDVSFPFWLFPKHSSSCGYPRFNLYCTDRHETALNLPNSGPFLVQEIKSQRIRLNDPDNCLARRLLSFNASESPFSPLHFVNYTFLICPNQDLKSSSLKPIHCLGNSTTSFFATPLELVGSIPPSCQVEPTSSKGVASFNLPIWLPLKIFIFVFLLLNASEANRCYSASCGVRNVDVRFPFWLFPKQPESCGHTGFNLLCTERHDHETALKLPNSGLFLVREIDYENQRIRLNDPNNCLARRLLNFDASESPFSPLYLLNYTFLTCPKEDVKSSPYEPIHCLGNSTTNFFATRIHLVSSIPSSCQVFKTLLLPISSPLAVDLNDQDLWLKWDSPDCKDCEGNRSMCGFKNKTSLEVKCFKSGKKIFSYPSHEHVASNARNR